MLHEFLAALLAVAVSASAIRFVTMLGWLGIAVVEYGREPVAEVVKAIEPAVDRFAALRIREAA